MSANPFPPERPPREQAATTWSRLWRPDSSRRLASSMRNDWAYSRGPWPAAAAQAANLAALADTAALMVASGDDIPQ